MQLLHNAGSEWIWVRSKQNTTGLLRSSESSPLHENRRKRRNFTWSVRAIPERKMLLWKGCRCYTHWMRPIRSPFHATRFVLKPEHKRTEIENETILVIRLTRYRADTTVTVALLNVSCFVQQNDKDIDKASCMTFFLNFSFTFQKSICLLHACM